MDEDFKAGPWWASWSDAEGKKHNTVGYVVANTEHYLVLTPDKKTAGNDITIPTAQIHADHPLVFGRVR